MTGSRVIRHTGDGWAGVEPREYKDDAGTLLRVIRHTLLGDSDADAGLDFEVRYFEVASGGHSSLERHQHAHAVLTVKGSGTVRLGERREAIRPLDMVYVAPGDIHRFEADTGVCLGFICVVDRNRDRPEVVDEEDEAR